MLSSSWLRPAAVVFMACMPTLALALNVSALPAGMCALDHAVPEHAVVMDYLASANQGTNRVIATFASCDEIAAIGAKKARTLNHYGVVLQQEIGQALPIDRATYVEAAGAALGNTALVKEAVGTATGAAAAGAKNASLNNPSNITAGGKKVLFKDKDMLVFGLNQTNSYGSQASYVASTAALTLLSGLPVSVNLYAPADEAGAFEHSTSALTKYIPALIAANP